DLRDAMSHTVRIGVLSFGRFAVTATLVPSGLTATEPKCMSGSEISLRTLAVPTSQIRNRSSWEPPVTSQVPSGPKARLVTYLVWGKTAHGSPVAASHKRTVLSQLPEASQRPSGL